jgi:lipopolysaccharide/colanic/teichoic acid biosynthesis glycosyltransferase
MRRISDVAVSLAALMMFSPVLLIIAVAVVFESRGNPFYGGWRVGRDGVRFRMWKFRTMVKNASQLGSSITAKKDPRITRVGDVLRRTKLDELPQFVNVLWGDMTLVGPRPESPDIVEAYTPSQRLVLQVKPGVTGRVQLDSGEESDNLPEGTEAREYYLKFVMDAKVRCDLEYLRRRTVRTDIGIVLQTATYVVAACLRGTGLTYRRRLSSAVSR